MPVMTVKEITQRSGRQTSSPDEVAARLNSNYNYRTATHVLPAENERQVTNRQKRLESQYNKIDDILELQQSESGFKRNTAEAKAGFGAHLQAHSKLGKWGAIAGFVLSTGVIILSGGMAAPIALLAMGVSTAAGSTFACAAQSTEYELMVAEAKETAWDNEQLAVQNTGMKLIEKMAQNAIRKGDAEAFLDYLEASGVGYAATTEKLLFDNLGLKKDQNDNVIVSETGEPRQQPLTSTQGNSNSNASNNRESETDSGNAAANQLETKFSELFKQNPSFFVKDDNAESNTASAICYSLIAMLGEDLGDGVQCSRTVEIEGMPESYNGFQIYSLPLDEHEESIPLAKRATEIYNFVSNESIKNKGKGFGGKLELLLQDENGEHSLSTKGINNLENAVNKRELNQLLEAKKQTFEGTDLQKQEAVYNWAKEKAVEATKEGSDGDGRRDKMYIFTQARILAHQDLKKMEAKVEIDKDRDLDDKSLSKEKLANQIKFHALKIQNTDLELILDDAEKLEASKTLVKLIAAYEEQTKSSVTVDLADYTETLLGINMAQKEVSIDKQAKIDRIKQNIRYSEPNFTISEKLKADYRSTASELAKNFAQEYGEENLPSQIREQLDGFSIEQTEKSSIIITGKDEPEIAKITAILSERETSGART